MEIGIGVLLLLSTVAFGVNLVFQIFCLIDALSMAGGAWDSAGHHKPTWLLILLLLPFASLVYWFHIRPQLVEGSRGVPTE